MSKHQPKITSFFGRKRTKTQETCDLENKKLKTNACSNICSGIQDILDVESDGCENFMVGPNSAQVKHENIDKIPNRNIHQPDEANHQIQCVNLNLDEDLKNIVNIFYKQYPKDAVEESIALANKSLHQFSGTEKKIEIPHTNIIDFSVYTQHGDLVYIDQGLAKRENKIYMSGYLKSMNCDCLDVDEDAVSVKNIGPVLAWYIRSIKGRNRITLSTKLGNYNLLKPSSEYRPLMNDLYEKMSLCKVVVEYLQDYDYMRPTYEDLLSVINISKIPDLNDMVMSEELLHKHAQFLCDQVAAFKCDENKPLITLPCMRSLVKLIGINFRAETIEATIAYKKVNERSWTKATTTPLIQKTFESFFVNQLDRINEETVLKMNKCGVCGPCQRPDCGECKSCLTMLKFGGNGQTTQVCVRRRCPKVAIQEAELYDLEDNAVEQHSPDKVRCRKEKKSKSVKIRRTYRNVKWVGNPAKVDATKVYYEKVKIDGAEYNKGDFVIIETGRPNIPSVVLRIVFMWKDVKKSNKGFFHAEVFIKSTATILNETGDPREVFLANRCVHAVLLSSILRKTYVEKRNPADDWFQLGGQHVESDFHEDDGKTYFYTKMFDRRTARFEDLPSFPICTNSLRVHRFCQSCERRTKLKLKAIPRVTGKLVGKSDYVKEAHHSEWTLVKWHDNEYKKGCGVFLRPGTFKHRNNIDLNDESTKTKGRKVKKEYVDEDLYPEHFRKSDNNVRGSNKDTKQPFCVGYIVAITVASRDHWLVAPQDIKIIVNVLYRPENTDERFPHREDMNLVYWSDEILEVPFSSVVGPCQLSYVDNIPQKDIYFWLEQDPNRIYFRKSYDKKSNKFKKIPAYAQHIGSNWIGDKGKGIGKRSNPESRGGEKEEKENVRPLRTLDVFAGCGGLSEGLRQSGVAECKWAIEIDEATAHAFSLNNKNCKVFNEDCNVLLKDILSGATHSFNGLRFPMKGEVELLCGGPPCQGFSGMNRFNCREYSNFKNSLVVSFLAYCDYYRPKYFILENVRNFVTFKKGMVLKLTLKALLDMGYQCTYGILQAGSYGVPQTRRRLIIFASAPGYKLPLFPEPTNVFNRRACSLSSTIDGKEFVSNIRWLISGPRRTCTIRDAMSDLPMICNSENEMEYDSNAESYFQRLVRSRDDNVKLRDHICKKTAPLVQARIDRIPTKPGSDWRDLPNTSVTLSDGTKSNVLKYCYEDKKHGRSSTGALRGICACAAGEACTTDKQENTLIPWCLPHTANRHGNWAGLYGRIAWDGYFSTTVTDPEPMGKQGRVLHPEQNRVVSVRECARSQGFPDTYILTGSVLDKYRQIGNAVPPPLGAALGREIKKVLL